MMVGGRGEESLPFSLALLLDRGTSEIVHYLARVAHIEAITMTMTDGINR